MSFDPAWLTPFAEPRFAWLAVAAVLAGLVRGFSGFGAAMMFMPIASAAYDPVTAIAVLWVIDVLVSLPYLAPQLRQCVWREVVPLVVGAAAGLPVGVWILVSADASVVRWFICVSVILAVAVMLSGWRYKKPPSLGVTLAAGGASGLAGGIASLYAPPILVFWLGGQANAPTVRANIFAFFGFTTLFSGVTYGAAGLFTGDRVLLSVPLLAVYALAMWIGARGFRYSTDAGFRRAALALCAISGVAGLPIW